MQPLISLLSRFVLTFLLAWFAPALQAQTLRLYVSPAVGQVFASLVPAMRESGVDARIDGEAGSSTAIQLLAMGKADAAFTVRPLTGEDRALAPDRMFAEEEIGTQAMAILVSRDVWESGVHALSREQLRRIYEREITNWKDVGGADREIKFFNYQHGQGVWEHFAQWVYGEVRKAPLGKFDVVMTGEDARNSVEFNGGSMSMGAPRWADGKEVFALALRGDDGTAIEPTSANLKDRHYPLARPVFVIFGDKPIGPRLRMLDFLRGAKGQELLAKSGLVPLAEPK